MGIASFSGGRFVIKKRIGGRFVITKSLGGRFVICRRKIYIDRIIFAQIQALGNPNLLLKMQYLKFVDSDWRSELETLKANM